MRRSDIQGLRAVGALLVAVFHIFQWGVSGGVDVFLTVSGFFLWSAAAKLAQGEARFRDHYVKFLSRTAPQAVLVVLVVVMAGLVFVSPVEWQAMLRDAAFSLVFFQNYWLAITGQDYLAREAGLSLFQHYWAVSTIAQVYCLFPVFALVAAVTARVTKAEAVTALTWVIAIASALSLGWSLLLSAWKPEIAHFDTLARVWQFGAGALVAGYLSRAGAAPSGNNLLSWIGLLAVLLCGLLLGRSFPGAASLWPTAGALLILVFSRDVEHPRNAGFVLSRPWVVWLGGLSFGIYLWHWPIYAIYFRFSPEQGLISAACIIAASILLAVLSTRAIAWVGQRFAQSGYGRYGLAATALSVIVVTGAGCAMLERAISWKLPGLMAMSHPVTGMPLSLTTVRADVPASYGMRCHFYKGSEVGTCSFGNKQADKTLYLIGGSHSAQWLPPFRKIARAEDFHLVSITKSGCRFFDPRAEGMQDYRDADCRQWNLNVLDYIAQTRPDYVVSLANTRGDAAPLGIQVALNRVAEMGVQVIALRDTPDMEIDIPACLSQFHVFEAPDCRVARADLFDEAQFQATSAALDEQVIVVDLNDEICPDDHCDVLRDQVVMWRDSHHLTATYARSLAGPLWDQIAAGLAAQRP